MNNSSGLPPNYPAPGSMIPPGSTIPPLQTASSVSSFSSQFSPSPVASSTSPDKKKRPGPKRDSKPAMSDKLERNRQAQRSHRERKELYMKELEHEVQRLKEMVVDTCRERDQAVSSRNQILMEHHRLMEELQSLRNQLSAPESTYSTTADSLSDATAMSSLSMPQQPLGNNFNPHAMAGMAGYREHTFDPYGCKGPAADFPSHQQDSRQGGSYKVESPAVSPTPPQLSGASPAIDHASDNTAQLHQVPSQSLDYDEIALDFVLSLERPCMSHGQYLMVRAHNRESQHPETGNSLPIPDEVPRDDENHNISGHTLMASVPSHSHIMQHPNTVASMAYPEGIQRKDLLRLLGLTSQLEIGEQELPPVKAWLRVLQNPRMRELSAQDFVDLKERLLGKVHCYRFGAVITEEDILDTVEEVLQLKGARAAQAG